MSKCPTCPGCSKHCPMGAPRCKYGRAYFEKQAAKQTEQSAKKCKWKTRVTPDSALWQLLSVSRRLKKALCHGEITEARLLSALDAQEQQALSVLLNRLENTLEKGV